MLKSGIMPIIKINGKTFKVSQQELYCGNCGDTNNIYHNMKLPYQYDGKS
jgi:hypothetical protein